MSDNTENPAENPAESPAEDDVAGHVVHERSNDDVFGIRSRQAPGIRSRVAEDTDGDPEAILRD